MASAATVSVPLDEIDFGTSAAIFGSFGTLIPGVAVFFAVALVDVVLLLPPQPAPSRATASNPRIAIKVVRGRVNLICVSSSLPSWFGAVIQGISPVLASGGFLYYTF